MARSGKALKHTGSSAVSLRGIAFDGSQSMARARSRETGALRTRVALVSALLLACTAAGPSAPSTGGGAGGSSMPATGGALATSGGTVGAPATGGSPFGAGAPATGGAYVASSGGRLGALGGALTGASGGALTGASGMTVAASGSLGQGGSSAGAPTQAGQAGGVTAGAAGIDSSAEIYDPNQLPRFDIELPPASITALNLVANSEDPRQDDYVQATFKYGTETIANIGLRIKGEGSFRKLDKKTAFKLKFDEYVNDQSFRGLRRLTLNNMIEDKSSLVERLAYDVFRAAKLPAPRCNSALVYVNGSFYGVYANVEAEDKTFLSRWFTSNDGNLYEEGQTDFVPGAENVFDLETNETANDRTDLRNLIAAVQGSTPANFLTAVGAHLDTTHFLRFTAAEAAVNQWDMYAYTVFYPNNFRIYNDPAQNKFVFLPWGMDMSMKPFRDSGKPHIKVFELARQGDNPSGRVMAGNLFQKCLASPTCKTAYAASVRELADLYENTKLETVAARYYAQIKPHVLNDPRKEYTAQEFESEYQSVLKTIRERPAQLRADVGP